MRIGEDGRFNPKHHLNLLIVHFHPLHYGTDNGLACMPVQMVEVVLHGGRKIGELPNHQAQTFLLFSGFSYCLCLPFQGRHALFEPGDAGLKIRLCCNNLLPNAGGVADRVLFSLSCHSKQGGDEQHLAATVSLRYPLKLPFPYHVHDLVPLECSPRGFKGEEAQPWLD
jgi:hypothetical protein